MLKNKKLKTVTNVVEWLVWAVLAAVFLTAISPVLPFENIPKTYVVITGSMEPTIKTGSLAIAKKVDPNEIKKGDVIVFTSPLNPKENILHRVEAIKSKEPLTFSTKGDNNNAPDAWDVYGEGVKGIMAGQIPYLGHAAAFIRKPLGFGLLIVFPALIFIISQIISIKKAIAAEIEKGVNKKLSEGIKGLIVVGLLTASATTLMGVKAVRALFEDKVTISGISLAVADFAPPETPRLLSPEDNLVLKFGAVGFKWTRVKDIGSDQEPSYIFQLCDGEFEGNICNGVMVEENIITNENNSNQTEVYISKDLEKGKNYRWRVRAADGEGNLGSWSQIFKVTTFGVDKVVSAITNLFGDNAANQNSKTIGYKAEAPGEVDRVDLCYRHNLGNFLCGGEYSSNSPEGNFEFNFSNGEGVYYFYTQAVSGEQNEDVEAKLADMGGLYKIQYDRTLPTSGIDLNNIIGVSVYDGQNLVEDGAFSIEGETEFAVFDPSSYISGIWYGQGDGNFEKVYFGVGLIGDTINPTSEGGMGRIGFTGKTNPAFLVQSNRVFQFVDIPVGLSSTLSFKYRVISNDTADNDIFRVRAESSSGGSAILETGSDENGGSRWVGDSGWRWFSKNLSGFAGQRTKIIFEVFDRDTESSSKDTWAFIDDVKLSTIDLRLGQEMEIITENHDTGSGVGDTSLENIQNAEGDQKTDYSTTDAAGNKDSTQRDDRITAPKVVLNVISLNYGDNGYIELFQNDPTVTNLDGWYLKNIAGETIPLAGGFTENKKKIEMFEKPNFIRGGLHDPGEMKLVYVGTDGDKIVDQTSYLSEDSASGQLWKRTPDGVGTWGLDTFVSGQNFNGPKVNTSVRVAAHKLLMSISSINNLNYLKYEITYGEGEQVKGIAGEIDLEKVPDTGQIDREFYLGSCSSMGQCQDEYVPLGSKITVKVSYKVNNPAYDPALIVKEVMFQ